MADNFVPDAEILDKYAKVLVDFALNSGAGIKPGDVVRLSVADSAKPLFVALRNQVLKSGGIPLTDYLPDGISRDYYDLASPDQLQFFPRKYYQGLADQIDHSIGVISEVNKHELEGVDSSKIMLRQKTVKPFRDWLDAKENQGKFTWTLALYGTPAMANESGMSLKEYWDQIIKACFLDDPDPIAKWRDVFKANNAILQKLNALPIHKLHLEGDGIDLWITLGENRKWLGGSGRNIPSFEVFTSPDWRGTSGFIEFNQPLYRYGNLITDIKLKFENGIVTQSSASKNYEVLKNMLNVENANKIGEFSLTDKRLSRIDKFMAETLFDENISGPFGNTHLALGTAYDDTFSGDLATLTSDLKAKLGFNNSAIHTDIISTTKRQVTAVLTDGSEKLIYKDGLFLL